MEALGGGLALLFDPMTMIGLFGGVFAGLVVGLIPGLGTGLALALLLPFTIVMEPSVAFAVIVGLLAVNTTSDTIPAVLFGVPGSSGAAATVVDGFEMSKQGRAKEALGAAYTASMIGGVFGAVLLGIAIPIMGALIPKIGTPELLAICILGLCFVSSVSGRSVLKGLASASIGVLLSFIGISNQTGEMRWTFDSLYLWDGLPFIPLTLGLYALPSLIDMIHMPLLGAGMREGSKGDSLLRGIRVAFRNWFLVLRSSWIGVMLGAIPGIGTSVIDWVAYGMAVRTAKPPSSFGAGDVRGVIAPEASNNARDGGAFVPTLALGIPATAGLAIVLGIFLIHGVTPGPRMLTDHLDLTYMLVWGLALANLIGGAACLFFTPQLARFLDIPARYLVAGMLVLVLMGAFQASLSLGDLWMVLGVGTIAFLMKALDWPRPPLLLGFILGEIIERYLFISIQIYDWHWLLRPGVLVILAIAAYALLRPLFGQQRKRAVSVEGMTTRPTRAFHVASVTFASVAAVCVVFLLILSRDWSASARIGPSIVGWLTLAVLAAVIATSALAAMRTPAGLPGQGFRTAGRGAVVVSLIVVYILLSGLIGLEPALFFLVPAVFVALGGRLGRACLFFTLGMFAFTVGLFEAVLAVPWPRPVFPVFQDFIFDLVR
ncbi:MAG: tripartite tricarboxylate transporter permease [Bauldia sp.]|nr:tripartite tricarboxylate transporter permease [Bauldia sp.]